VLVDDALRSAAVVADLLDADPGAVEVVRVGAAVLVHLPDAGTMLRVEASNRVASAERQVAAARMLERADVSAVRLAALDDQPRQIGPTWVTAWEWIEVLPRRMVEPDALGALARHLHDRTATLLADGADLDVPTLDPFGAIDDQLDAAAGIGRTPPGDLRLLRGALADCAERWAAGPPDPLGTALVHGDLHAQNVLLTQDGPVLVDLELAGVGPPTYDLAAQVVARERYGAPEAAYRRFAAAYGFDLRDWEGAPLRSRTYALWTTAWAVAHRQVSPANEAEAERRVQWWRDPTVAPRWTIL
jgi:hypothetical protein